MRSNDRDQLIYDYVFIYKSYNKCPSEQQLQNRYSVCEKSISKCRSRGSEISKVTAALSGDAERDGFTKQWGKIRSP